MPTFTCRRSTFRHGSCTNTTGPYLLQAAPSPMRAWCSMERGDKPGAPRSRPMPATAEMSKPARTTAEGGRRKMPVKQMVTRTLQRPVIWRKPVLMIATALFLTSIIAIGLTRFGRGADQPKVDATALSQPTRFRLVQGQRLVYELEYSGKAVADFSILSSQGTSEPRQTPIGSQQTFHTTLTGQFVATVLQRDAEKTVVAYRVRDAAVRVSVNGQESGADAEAAEADLGREVYASLDEQGRVISLQFDSATGNLAQSVTRSLLAAVQFVAPAVWTKDLRKWQSEE